MQFENENDVTPSVINMSIPCFPVFQVFKNITKTYLKKESCITLTSSSLTLLGMTVIY